jgi:hypothetical protein
MAKNPYEWIYERESQPLKEYVLDEVSKILAQAVEEFPPQIDEWEREDLRARFEPMLAALQGRPQLGVVRVALALFRLELDRDVVAIDDYMRNERWAAEGLTPLEREQAIFLWQFWTEQTLVFKNYAGNKFKWAELMGLADRLEKRLVEEQSPLRH